MTQKNGYHLNLNNDHSFTSISTKLIWYSQIYVPHTPKVWSIYYFYFWLERSSKFDTDFHPCAKSRHFFDMKKIFNALLRSTPCLKDIWVANLAYWLICRESLHNLVSKFSQKFENWGFRGILQLFSNKKNASIWRMGENRYQTLNFALAKSSSSLVYTSNFRVVWYMDSAVPFQNFVLIGVKLLSLLRFLWYPVFFVSPCTF